VDRTVGHDMIADLKEMYETDEAARIFFDWAALRRNDATSTSIDLLAQKADTDPRAAREIAKQLAEIGCGDFVVGRRGAKSRIVWTVSLKSIGKAAAGRSGEIEPVDSELFEDSADLNDGGSATAASTFTIAEAKLRLAASLGVRPEAIEITVRG
jgi:hypothetical protein